MDDFNIIQAIEAWERDNLPGYVSGSGVQRCLSPHEGGGVWWAVALGPMSRTKGIGTAPTLREAFEKACTDWERNIAPHYR